MEYLNVAMGIMSYFLAAGIYAALRRGEAGGAAFKYFIDFLFLFSIAAGAGGDGEVRAMDQKRQKKKTLLCCVCKEEVNPRRAMWVSDGENLHPVHRECDFQELHAKRRAYFGGDVYTLCFFKKKGGRK